MKHFLHGLLAALLLACSAAAQTLVSSCYVAYPAGTTSRLCSTVDNLSSGLAARAPLASPVFTGDPQAPTPTAADNDTSLATTAYVSTGIVNLKAATNTWANTQTAPNYIINAAAGVNRILSWRTAGAQRWSLYADSAAEGGLNTGSGLRLASYDDTGAATVLFIASRATGVVAFSISPTAPTPTPGDNSTKVPTTAFTASAIAAAAVRYDAVQTLTSAQQIQARANIGATGSISLTGDVTAPSGAGALSTTLSTTQAAVHTWSDTQTFTKAPIFSSQQDTRNGLAVNPIGVQIITADANQTINGNSSASVVELPINSTSAHLLNFSALGSIDGRAFKVVYPAGGSVSWTAKDVGSGATLKVLNSGTWCWVYYNASAGAYRLGAFGSL
jgi:hypothetical protein